MDVVFGWIHMMELFRGLIASNVSIANQTFPNQIGTPPDNCRVIRRVSQQLHDSGDQDINQENTNY